MKVIDTQHHFDWFCLNSRERRYQLRVGQQEMLSLTWQNIRGTCATADAHSERWIFTCIGYLSRLVIVQSVKTGKTLATFKPGAGGGTLRFVDGHNYTLRAAHSLHLEMVWQNEQGETVVRFNGDFGDGIKSGGVELTEQLPSIALNEVAMLMSLGWYLMVSSRLDMTVIL